MSVPKALQTKVHSPGNQRQEPHTTSGSRGWEVEEQTTAREAAPITEAACWTAPSADTIQRFWLRLTSGIQTLSIYCDDEEVVRTVGGAL